MTVDYLVILGYLLAIVGVGWWGVSLVTKPTDEAVSSAWRRRLAGEPAGALSPAAA